MKITNKQYNELYEYFVQAGSTIDKGKLALFRIKPSATHEESESDQSTKVTVSKIVQFQRCGHTMCGILRQLIRMMKDEDFFYREGQVVKKRETIFTLSDDTIFNKKNKAVIRHVSDAETIEFHLNNLTGLLVSFFSKCKNKPLSLLPFYQLIPVIEGDMELSTTNIFKLAKHLKHNPTDFSSNYLEFIRLLWSSIPSHIPNEVLSLIPYEFYRQILLFIDYKYPHVQVNPDLINYVTNKAKTDITDKFPDLVSSLKAAIELNFDLDVKNTLSEIGSVIPESRKRKRFEDH